MKRMKVTEKIIGENKFYIKPFPAFTTANISGELASVISPIISGLSPLFGGKELSLESAMSMDISEAAPAISGALSGISGDKVERLMRHLLVDNRNISVEGEVTDGAVAPMDLDLANEVFCGEVQDMYILCYEVIKINFNGFFKKIGALFGDRQGPTEKAPVSKSGATSTQLSSQS